MAHTKVYGFCDAKCKVEVVPKNGGTFEGNVNIQRSSASELTLVNTSISKNYEKWKQVAIINGKASDGNIGQIEFLRNTPGGHLGSSIQLTAYNSTGGGKYIVLYSFDDGVSQEAYVQHPSWMVGTNDNSDKSLTIKMANKLPSLLHTYDNETADGQKTFTSPIIDPQNQSGCIQTPNSNASSTPYYCVASCPISSFNSYDRSSFTFDIVAERYGDSIVYGTIQVNLETDANKNIYSSAIAMIYKSSTSSVASNVANWFLTYNQTKNLIQVWCKLTSNQYVIRTRNRFNGSRYSNYTSWKLLNATTGQATAPSSDDGWVTVNCVDMSNKLAESTDINATEKEIATADWVLGKLPKKTEFTSWAELEALIKAGKRGDSFNLTMDFTGLTAISGATSSSATVHAFGHYHVDEITVSGGAITKAEMFGSGEVQFKVDGTTKTFGTTGFGADTILSAFAWAFRSPSEGSVGYAIIGDGGITSCTGYYISL